MASAMVLSTVCTVVPVRAGGTPKGAADTLRQYDVSWGIARYRTPEIAGLASRFALSAPKRITGLRIVFTGDSTGTAQVSIVDHGAGSAVPYHGRPMGVVSLVKERPGLDTVSVTLPSAVDVYGDQFFVVVDGLPAGVTVATDRLRRTKPCVELDGRARYDQLFRMADGQWRGAERAFVIDVITETLDHDSTTVFRSDTAWSRALPRRGAGSAVSVGDVDGDGRADVLTRSGLSWNVGSLGQPQAVADSAATVLHAVLIDHDIHGARPLVLHRGAVEAQRVTPPTGGRSIAVVYHRMDDLHTITAAAVADVDADGYDDVVVAGIDSLSHVVVMTLRQRSDGSFDHRPLLNDTMVRELPSLYLDDRNADGRLEVHAIGRTSTEDRHYDLDPMGKAGDEHGRTRLGERATYAGYRSGGMMRDPSTTGSVGAVANVPDRPAVQPVVGRGPGAPLAAETAAGSIGGPAGSHGDDDGTPRSATAVLRRSTLLTDDHRSSVVVLDTDNDGTDDILATSACPCRPTHMYAQRQGGLERLRLPAATGVADAAVADMDGDGRLDLVFVRNDSVHVLRNHASAEGRWVEVTMDRGQGRVPRRVDIGEGETARSWVFASGRGLLVQEPPVVHIGLGDVSQLDSARVTWSDGSTTQVRGLAAGSRQRLGAGGAPERRTPVSASLQAYPNPAQRAVSLVLTSNVSDRVELRVLDQQGRVVATLGTVTVVAGERLEHRWDLTQADVGRLSSGLYRIVADGADVHVQTMLTVVD